MASQITMYRFKDITVVPEAKDLVDIVLSKTQRKTPTEVHKQFRISRIRSFYLRKVKFCQQTIHDKLCNIIQQFPRLDEIHPFYGDLCNVLYDRDHYKLALGQCNTIKNVVDNIAKEYVKLMKYADSLYKCKMLKRAALGRMCTALKKLQGSFKYLEEVRQHLSRLPSINPNTRTLIVCGYPNVGKSSFMNKVSHANVEVQPYAFTTKSLFVGHFDFHYSRFQVIDTPGILDRPLEERNTIEMTAITALAHIHCAVLYFIDISESCGFSIECQINLFESIRPLFKNKPIILVINKIDLIPFSSLPLQTQNNIQHIAEKNDITVIQCSTLTTEGVDLAKDKACSLLLEQRISSKCESIRGDNIMNRLYITNVNVDTNKRPPCIPPSVLLNKKLKEDGIEEKKIKTEKELQEEMGGPGVYSCDIRKNYILEKEEWKNDIVPEIWKGKNIADFVDVNIEEKIKLLEEEEKILLSQEYTLYDPDEEWENSQNVLKKLHLKIAKQRVLNRLKKTNNAPPRSKKKASRLSQIEDHIRELGLNPSLIKNRAICKRRSLSAAGVRTLERGKSKHRSSSVITRRNNKEKYSDEEDYEEEERNNLGRKASIRAQKRLRSLGYKITDKIQNNKDKDNDDKDKHRNEDEDEKDNNNNVININGNIQLNKLNRIDKSIHSIKNKLKVEKIKRKMQKKFSKNARKGEADRSIPNIMPKHLFSGKRGLGKTNRR